MTKHWDTYSRQGVDLASSTASWGFGAIKSGTRLGFAVTRGIAATAVGITTSALDQAFFGGGTVTRPVIGAAVSTVLSFAEQVTLAPIYLSEYITSTSLVAAHGSINVLSAVLPGSSEASFSLASFITLVRREWNEPVAGECLPETHYSFPKVVRAIVGWVALQGVTQEWQEKRWFKYLKEIHVKDTPRSLNAYPERRNSRVRVTSDIIITGYKGQIIAADIGEAPTRAQSLTNGRTKAFERAQHTSRRPTPLAPPPRLSNTELKATLRRLSKMVLAGYGGASLLFFGVAPSPAHGTTSANSPAERATEEAQLTSAIDASEAEAAGDPDASVPSASDSQYSWWDLLLGKHDQEIFESSVNLLDEKAKAEIKAAKIRATAVVGSEHLMPRFWVLTDHGRGQIVLVLRGTASVNELAVDLTCDLEEFEPATTATNESNESPAPGQFPFPNTDTASTDSPKYHVHSGMLRMARAMGDVGKPVQLAVQKALHDNPGYELVMCGHSLGAGVAAILGLIWADPRTCLTVESSGLPVGRRVFVYCIAPPCLTDVALSRLASELIVSFVHSHDVVSRLSLGSVRDLKSAAMWLCDANEKEGKEGKDGEGHIAVTRRAKRWTAGLGSLDDPDWFIAMRTTLEANMHMATLFPPGKVLWAMRDSALHPSHRLYAVDDDGGSTVSTGPDKLRLFEVLDVEQVFSQIVFARDMLSAHMPQKYDRALHDLL